MTNQLKTLTPQEKKTLYFGSKPTDAQKRKWGKFRIPSTKGSSKWEERSKKSMANILERYGVKNV